MKRTIRVLLHTTPAWSFAQLKGFIAYKAEDRGLMVGTVDPRHTSQTCSACRHQARNNRRSQGDFWCRSCGYRLNADLNGARNIAAKYLAIRGTPPGSGLPVMQPLVSEISHRTVLPDVSRLLSLTVHDYASEHGKPHL